MQSRVYGAAVIKYMGEVTHMTVLDGFLKEQFHLWSSFNPMVQLLRFQVVHICPLENLEVIQQLSDRVYRGSVCQMEAGQPDMLFEKLGADWPYECPQITVRLPSPLAALCSKKACSDFLLPHDTVTKGVKYLRVRLDLLELEPLPPPAEVRPFAGDGDVVLTPGILRRISDQLRAAARTLDPASEMDEEEYKSLEESILLLDHVAVQLSPAEVHRQMVGCKRGGIGIEVGGRTPLSRTLYMIKAFMLCNLLKESGKIHTSLMYAISLALPPALLECVKQYVNTNSKFKLSKGTVSRWKMLIDGALLLYGRDLDAELS
eukprot:6450492-Pyramimonas_sp.AAC.1